VLTTSRYSIVTNRRERKVVIILKELDIPYETEFVDFALIKQKPYTDINPNGRVPAITDPNTGITLWESAAIIEYLVDQYDKESKLTYRKAPEKYYLRQYTYFQMSGERLFAFRPQRLIADQFQAKVHIMVRQPGSHITTTKSSHLPRNVT
jgi:glutathione S-transferase